ncbi:efflux RND transporter periplasmic adaptor subunit [Methylotenera sp.]|uniref:efflux RND transporter periplasmic adaptor subunit n=1 Tax=Methylotenera sp. TaxID=2051956 RepID=UPI002726DC0B|nr:efflux RND transporter periplasmic adaptor subunit [Methylotenera sp.]MDO9204949.1 efflux RND transporter periplasmic adaptor subunit [Methylotenera sp.]MDP2071136.1 efflux RND transporter periplasmic adaptor subunit [Methylotenera sp.]MDP2230062.1 efflux RND transporter periplasmic adaptor subunit [Methylotenera sp.]MDP3007299.1 efflux RND transporter periplasmic adaptor subunit [Methylotenera sp.]MDP3142126.1 efflux RND transporter periplasmic adaptor subunit [Methylotenera sp.]
MIKQYQWFLVFVMGFVNIALPSVAGAASLATVTVKQSNSALTFTAEGVVEAVKSSVIAPQVSGSITALPVKAGDYVKTGQLLVRIDTRMAAQQAMSNQAQVAAAQAQLNAARKEYERKHRLYEKQYISQAALERAESDYKTAEAQTKAQLAQTGMSSVQTGLHTINAPYSGVIAEVMTEVGGMAMPGQPILALYDPSGFRVRVNVPQSQLANLKAGPSINIQVPAANEGERSVISTNLTVLPTADSVSNMSMVRLTLPQNLASVRPGMFARAMLPVNDVKGKGQIFVPVKSVIKRSELMAVYVVDKQGRPQLRQVRLGRKQGENIEVFAGLQLGELVALDPIAAANVK